ncbi:MAG: DUF3106 domain-containing protein [Bryobacteraceae bacterium]
MKAKCWLALLIAALELAPWAAWGQPRARPRAGPGPAARPGGAIERLSRMPPEQRRRLLERLPPERRQRLEQELERYHSLPPEEHEKLQEQLERFRSLPLEQQVATRKLFRRFLELPQDRRQALREEFARLRSLPPPQRRKRVASEEVRKLYNRRERQILEDYVELLPPEE